VLIKICWKIFEKNFTKYFYFEWKSIPDSLFFASPPVAQWILQPLGGGSTTVELNFRSLQTNHHPIEEARTREEGDVVDGGHRITLIKFFI